MANVISNVFKDQLLKGNHNFQSGGDTYKVALYTSSRTAAATDSVFTIAPPSDEPLCDSTKSLIWGRSVTHILPDVKKFTDYTQKTNQKLISQVRMNEHEAKERL